MKTFRDKNDFQVEPGEDWNDKKSDQTIKYMTSSRKTPYTEPRRLANGGSSNPEVIVNNGKIQTKNEFIKTLPLEEQPGYDADKDPNLLRRIKYYQGESLGADFDRAIALEDIELKKLGRDPANILQRNRKVDPLVPKRATTKQMQELKGKIDKYKDVHFPKEKPFKKPTLKDKPVRKPNAVPPKTNTIKMAPLPPINFDLIPGPLERDPEIVAAEKRFLESVRRNEEEKFRNANSGLAGLMGGDPRRR
jgi:hypothetical protein